MHIANEHIFIFLVFDVKLLLHLKNSQVLWVL